MKDPPPSPPRNGYLSKKKRLPQEDLAERSAANHTGIAILPSSRPCIQVGGAAKNHWGGGGGGGGVQDLPLHN